jgi:hypothetical protein
MEMLCKEVLQSFALVPKLRREPRVFPERKSKEVQRAISAKDIEWQAGLKSWQSK